MHAIVVAHEVRELLAEPPPETPPGVVVIDVGAVPTAEVGWRVTAAGAVVSPDAPAAWWIDGDGHKHAEAAAEGGPPRQQLACAWADRLIRDGGAWRVEAPAEASARLAAGVVAQGHAAIDALCDAAYTVSPSRGARYQRKEEEARAFVASEAVASAEEIAAAYPIIAAEAAARGLSVADMAAEVIAAADAYHALAATAEAARARLTVAVNAAAMAGDFAAMEAAADVEIEIVRAALS